MNEVTYNRIARRLDLFLDEIALAANEDGTHLIEHIGRHANEHLALRVAGKKDWRSWSAGMHNLLAIFDRTFLHVPITPHEQLDRLLDYAARNPDSVQEPDGAP